MLCCHGVSTKGMPVVDVALNGEVDGLSHLSPIFFWILESNIFFQYPPRSSILPLFIWHYMALVLQLHTTVAVFRHHLFVAPERGKKILPRGDGEKKWYQAIEFLLQDWSENPGTLRINWELQTSCQSS